MTDRKSIIHVTAADCIEQHFNVGGGGGQRRDRKKTGCRFIHPPSRARGECREHREGIRNRRAAFRRMAESDEFQRWIRVEHAKATGEIEAAVDTMMRPEHLNIEYGPF